MRAGQKVIVFGRNISSFILDADKNIGAGLTAANAGALVINLDGKALGIALSNTASPFAAMDLINKALPEKN
jgi:hypothetical protein